MNPNSTSSPLTKITSTEVSVDAIHPSGTVSVTVYVPGLKSTKQNLPASSVTVSFNTLFPLPSVPLNVTRTPARPGSPTNCHRQRTASRAAGATSPWSATCSTARARPGDAPPTACSRSICPTGSSAGNIRRQTSPRDRSPSATGGCSSRRRARRSNSVKRRSPIRRKSCTV